MLSYVCLTTIWIIFH